MLFRDIIFVCSENHATAINTLCGQNAEFLYFKSGSKQPLLIIQVRLLKQQLLLICITLDVSTFKASSSGVSNYTLLHYWIAT
jgi:hypothetical protein